MNGTRTWVAGTFSLMLKMLQEAFYENADGKQMPGMNSPAIKRQLRNHWRILMAELERKNIKWYLHKTKGKKKVTLNYIK